LTPAGVKTPVNLAHVRGRLATGEATMDQESLRLLIQRRIRDGRLPHDGIKKVWTSRSDGERCDGCDAIISKDQMLMEGVTIDLGRRPVQLHVRCFQVWDHERRAA